MHTAVSKQVVHMTFPDKASLSRLRLSERYLALGFWHFTFNHLLMREEKEDGARRPALLHDSTPVCSVCTVRRPWGANSRHVKFLGVLDSLPFSVVEPVVWRRRGRWTRLKNVFMKEDPFICVMLHDFFPSVRFIWSTTNTMFSSIRVMVYPTNPPFSGLLFVYFHPVLLLIRCIELVQFPSRYLFSF